MVRSAEPDTGRQPVSSNGDRGRLMFDAAMAVAAGSTIDQAASQVGVSARTLYRWSAQASEFRNYLAQLRAQTVRAVGTQLSVAMVDAIAALRELLKHEDAAVRVRAASELLANGLKADESLRPKD